MKNTLIISILLLIVFRSTNNSQIIGSSSTAAESEQGLPPYLEVLETQEGNEDESGTLVVIDKPVQVQFNTHNDTLTLSDTLGIRTATAQLVEMAVIKPDGTYMLLVSDKKEKKQAAMQNKAQFQKEKQLQIIPRLSKSFPYTVEYNHNIPVIDQEGWYEFRTSTNLHTDYGYMEVKKIYFTNKRAL